MEAVQALAAEMKVADRGHSESGHSSSASDDGSDELEPGQHKREDAETADNRQANHRAVQERPAGVVHP